LAAGLAGAPADRPLRAKRRRMERAPIWRRNDGGGAVHARLDDLLAVCRTA